MHSRVSCARQSAVRNGPAPQGHRSKRRDSRSMKSSAPKTADARPERLARGADCGREGACSAGVCRRWRGAANSACRISRRWRRAASADLPGNAYALGFLRTYAGALRTGPRNEISRRFKRRSAGVNQQDRACVSRSWCPNAAFRLARWPGRRGAGDRRLCGLVSSFGVGSAGGAGGAGGDARRPTTADYPHGLVLPGPTQALPRAGKWRPPTAGSRRRRWGIRR